jgi:hypothetical protein
MRLRRRAEVQTVNFEQLVFCRYSRVQPFLFQRLRKFKQFLSPTRLFRSIVIARLNV